MRLCAAAYKGVSDLKREIQIVVGSVQYHGDHGTVGVLEGYRFDFGSPFATANAFCALLNVFAEMTDVIISRS